MADNLNPSSAVVPSLDDELDSCHEDVPKHLGQIADTVSEWEGQLSEELGLKPPDVSAIKVEYPSKLKLQT